jgi:hypothetical protein
MILELLCGLDYEWDGQRLTGELEALLAAEAAAAAPQSEEVYPPRHPEPAAPADATPGAGADDA